ncbi:MAG TPA: membrane protein insertase YidC [Chitinophagaceae bacterium]|nr:membrane protein insertase YidC [Chitinophagaceae bacterium]
MKFDRNTVLGFVLLALLFFGFFYFNNQEQARVLKNKAIQDSIAKAALPKPKVDTSSKKSDTSHLNTPQITNVTGQFQKAMIGSEQLAYVENDLVKVAFTNKGGQVKWVELKNFKDQEKKLVKLASTDFDKIDYQIKGDSGQVGNITEFYFTGGNVLAKGDSLQTITYTLGDSSGRSITHEFVLRKGDYMIDFNIKLNKANTFIDNETMNLQWQYRAKKQEKDLSYERTNSQMGYVMDDDFDYFTIGRRSDVQFAKPVQWVAMRQRFFNGILVAKDNFSGGKMEWNSPNDSATVVQSTATLQHAIKGSDVTIPLSIYYGPSDFRLLKKYDKQMGKLVNLGQGIYAFVRPINKFVVLPVFDFFSRLVGSYGIAILLLTFVIRLLISPLTYTSYLSGAKMKVLRPEIEKLKAKHGGDQQAMSMDQMKLFKEAGVNPLGGCIPALLQIPIFFALYSFFNSYVDLRGENFLWANDLSAYDSILTWGNIPVISSILGNHLSLFTITACLTSFLISLYSMSMTPDQSNPVLKYMPYFFPIFLLFIFNRLPAALTWYYTVSNLVTLGLQFVIQNYIINHDKILAKMDQNRKKPKSKSKWQERFEQMQEQQKKLKDMQAKGKR